MQQLSNVSCYVTLLLSLFFCLFVTVDCGCLNYGHSCLGGFGKRSDNSLHSTSREVEAKYEDNELNHLRELLLRAKMLAEKSKSILSKNDKDYYDDIESLLRDDDNNDDDDSSNYASFYGNNVREYDFDALPRQESQKQNLQSLNLDNIDWEKRRRRVRRSRSV